MKARITTLLLFTCALLSLSGCDIMDSIQEGAEKRKTEKYEDMLRPFTGTWNTTRYDNKNPYNTDPYMSGITRISFSDDQMTVFKNGLDEPDYYSYVKKTENTIEDIEIPMFMENGILLVQGSTHFQNMSYIFKCTRKIGGKAYHTLELHLPAGILYLSD